MRCIEDDIRKDIADFMRIDIRQLEKEDDLVLDYHFDSLDIFRLSIMLEDKYGVQYNIMKQNELTTVSAIVRETIRLIGHND